jgi:hypothetical protein
MICSYIATDDACEVRPLQIAFAFRAAACLTISGDTSIPATYPADARSATNVPPERGAALVEQVFHTPVDTVARGRAAMENK